jgi:hypothetical protein
MNEDTKEKYHEPGHGYCQSRKHCHTIVHHYQCIHAMRVTKLTVYLFSRLIAEGRSDHSESRPGHICYTNKTKLAIP